MQTPQAYGNLHTVIARGAAYMQTVFYRFAQRGRNRFNAAFCVGTNVIFRRAAIDDIGGMHTDSKSEDVWTALSLHERGWRSVYISDILAVGDAPETIEAYSKQQLRWATGGFEILLTHNPLSPKRRLTGDQRIQYFVTATFYLTGICPAPAAARPAARDLLRPAADEPHDHGLHVGVLLRGLLRHADPARVVRRRIVPLGDADALDRLVPDLHESAARTSSAGRTSAGT